MKRLFVSVTALVVGLTSTHSVFSVEDLPRAYGPFSLGMTVGAFSKLTGAPVFGAKTGDTVSSLKAENLEKFVPAKNRAREHNAGFVFAGKNPDSKLYQIGYTPDETSVDVIKSQYARFGAPRTVRLPDTDRSALEWCQKGKTRILVAYKNGSIRAASVTIEELAIMGQALADEGQSTERATCGQWP
ncbi:MAG: hypothetical protein ABIP64_08615 [Burkholderiales bacterium]